MAWSRSRYGVFPESGFEGDRMFPARFDLAGEERENRGCEPEDAAQVSKRANRGSEREIALEMEAVAR